VDKPFPPELSLVDPPSAPHPAQHKLLSRTVADWLAGRIIDGEEPPGTRLMETKLAELAGVSRSPVREALRILAGEGLVEIVPRIGAQVARVGQEDVTQLYACRMLLEPRAAGLAAEAVSRQGLAELDGLRTAMERAVADHDPRRFLNENVAYFRALLAHCPNDVLRELVDLTWTKAMRYWSIFARLPNYGRGSLEHHRSLHDAVHARDRASAEQADRAILERALNEILHTLPGAAA
jgi:DNA-binding GntR family transcriptional regulator